MDTARAVAPKGFNQFAYIYPVSRKLDPSNLGLIYRGIYSKPMLFTGEL